MNGFPSVEVLIHAGRERVPYPVALNWMHARAESVRAGGIEAVALLEHDPVYTLGARAPRGSLRVPESDLPAPLIEADRGGDVTWHGPGQLVLYPVLDLRGRGVRVGDYVRALEGIAIDTLLAWGINGVRITGRPGVWVDGTKIAAVGVRIDRGVSRHGLALNVAPDLRWFEAIVPCGIHDAGVTSMAARLGDALDISAVAEVMAEVFSRAFASVRVEAVPA